MRNVKIFILLAVCVGFANGSFAQIEVSPKINKVTLYQNQYIAEIDKEAIINLNMGENVVILKGNSPKLQQQYLLFEENEHFSITDHVLMVRNVTQSPYNNDKIPAAVQKDLKSWTDSLENYRCQQADVVNLLEILAQEKAAMNNMGMFHAKSRLDSVPGLKSSLTFYRQQMVKIQKEIQNNHREKEKVDARIKNLQNNVNLVYQNYGVSPTTTKSEMWIKIVVVADKKMTAVPLHYSYRTSGVNWNPVYDLKVSSDTRTAAFVLKAEVTQNTGEDWNDVQLAFSNEVSRYSNGVVALNPFVLEYNKRTKMAAGAVCNQAMSDDEAAISEVVVAYKSPVFSNQVTNTMLGKEYLVTQLHSICSSSNIKTITLETQTKPAEFAYHAIPKRAEKVYLRTLIPQWQDLNLMEASTKIYLDKKHISNTHLSNYYNSDTLPISIGPDYRVFIDREVFKVSNTKAGVVETDVTISIKMKNNNNNQTVTLSLEDQIPITSIDEIKITDVRTDGGKVDAQTGIVTWDKVVLKPAESKEIKITYQLKVPKKLDIHLQGL